MLYKKRKLNPSLDDIMVFTSPKHYSKYMGKSISYFYKLKSEGRIITAYICNSNPDKGYRRVYMCKDDVVSSLGVVQ